MTVGSVNDGDLNVNYVSGTSYTPPVGPVPGALNSIQSAPVINVQGSQQALLEGSAISILAFARLINGSLSELKQALFETEIVDIRALQSLTENILARMIALESRQKALREYYDALVSVYDKRADYVSDINQAIQTYNLGYTATGAIADLNAAAQALNDAAELDPESPEYEAAVEDYNTAVAAYNDLVDGSNDALTALNLKVEEYLDGIAELNEDLAEVNEKGAAFSIPFIANFTSGVTLKDLLEVAETSPPAVPGSIDLIEDPGPILAPEPDNPTIDSFDTYFNTHLQTDTQALTQDIQRSQVQRNALLRDLDNRLFYLKGVSLNPAIAAAYTTAAPQIFVESATGQGAGVSLSTMIGGLSSPILERLVGYGLFVSNIQDQKINFNKKLSDQLVAFNLSFYNPIGLLGGKHAAGLLADNLGTAPLNGDTTSIAGVGGFTKAASQFVESSSEVLTPSISNILQKELGLDSVKADQLAASLVNLFGISILFNALSGLGEALGIKDLAQKAINELPEGKDLQITEQKPTDAFNDTIQRFLLKSVLFEAGQTFFDNEKRAAQTINDAIDKVALGLKAGATTEDIRGTLVQEFLARGVTQQQATQLADTSVLFIKGDPSLKLFAPVASQGTPATEAVTTAQAPITAPQTSSVTDQIRNQTIALIAPEIGETGARNLADSLLSIVDPRFPHSAANLINIGLEKLRKELGDDKFKAAKSQLEDVFSRHDDPVVLLKRFLDPGNSLLMSYMTGLMYDVDIPTNWQRPLNIQI